MSDRLDPDDPELKRRLRLVGADSVDALPLPVQNNLRDPDVDVSLLADESKPHDYLAGP